MEKDELGRKGDRKEEEKWKIMNKEKEKVGRKGENGEKGR